MQIRRCLLLFATLLALFSSPVSLAVGQELHFSLHSKEPWQSNDPKSEPSQSWMRIAKYFVAPELSPIDAQRYRSPLLFSDGREVSTAEQWLERRQEILAEWEELLGHWPPLIESPSITVLETVERDEITQQKIQFLWTPKELTTGYLLIPKGKSPKPGVVTVYYEPESSLGLGAEHRDYGWLLAKQGFVVLSIGTTEATKAQTYSIFHPSLDDATVQPLSMLAYAAANAWHVLANREDVDPHRIGIVGHSFGGKWAMFASCLYEKFACAAWSDPGIMFDNTRASINYWEPWYLGYHPKPWRTRGLITDDNPAYGAYPELVLQGRDLHELHALMAPRPFFVSGGEEDPPNRWTALSHSIAVNKLLGYSARVGMSNREEHSPNAEANQAVVDFFVYFIGDKEKRRGSQ